MVLIVPPIGNDWVSVCVMKDTECVGDAVMRGSADEVEAVTYSAEVEVASETEVEVSMGIGENGWVVKVTRFSVVVASCAKELSETSVVEHSVGMTNTVVVTLVVNLPFAVEVASLEETVLELSEAVSEYSGASVTVEVEYVVEEAMSDGKSVISASLEVEVAVAASVVVESLSEKASPSGMLIPGMSEAAGVVVAVVRLVGRPVSTVTVEVESVVEEAMADGKSVIPASLDVEVAVAASVVVESLSEKASPSGMLIPGMSEAAGVVVTVGRPVSTASVAVVATDVLDTSSPPPPLLSLWSSEEPPPLIPPFSIARASSWVMHETICTPNGELELLPRNRNETYSAIAGFSPQGECEALEACRARGDLPVVLRGADREVASDTSLFASCTVDPRACQKISPVWL